jgi:hypothetical protein
MAQTPQIPAIAAGAAPWYRELERQGLEELMFASGTQAKWHMAEDFSRLVMARL